MWMASPVATIQKSRTTRPHTTMGSPREFRASSSGALRCARGTGTVLRALHNVSPSTALDAQWSSDRGGGKALGFTAVHRQTSTMGTSDHQPIHVRLHTAAVSAAGIGMRV